MFVYELLCTLTCLYNTHSYIHIHPFIKLISPIYAYMLQTDWEEYSPPMYRQEWTRVIRTPIKAKGHVIMDVCHPEGSILRHTLTRSQVKEIPSLYTALRKTTWGGLFPAVQRTGSVHPQVLTETPLDEEEEKEGSVMSRIGRERSGLKKGSMNNRHHAAGDDNPLKGENNSASDNGSGFQKWTRTWPQSLTSDSKAASAYTRSSSGSLNKPIIGYTTPSRLTQIDRRTPSFVSKERKAQEKVQDKVDKQYEESSDEPINYEGNDWNDEGENTLGRANGFTNKSSYSGRAQQSNGDGFDEEDDTLFSSKKLSKSKAASAQGRYNRTASSTTSDNSKPLRSSMVESYDDDEDDYLTSQSKRGKTGTSDRSSRLIRGSSAAGRSKAFSDDDDYEVDEPMEAETRKKSRPKTVVNTRRKIC